MKKILVAAGGTGGHLFPAIAVVEKLKILHKNNIDFEFFGRNDKIEGRVVPELGYKLHNTNLHAITKKMSLATIKLPFQILRAIYNSINIIKKNNIDAVLCAGAYLSIPPGIAAKLCNKKLFLMESNVNLGKANRFLSSSADVIFTSFEETKTYFSISIQAKIKYTGNPVRQAILAPQNRIAALKKFDLQDMPTVLIFGGSLGAKSINKAVLKYLDKFANANYQIVWQSGSIHKFQVNLPKNIKLVNFIDDMASAYAVADLVVSRSGAATIAELCVAGKPSVLVPLPSAANNEQLLNAKALENIAAAVIVADSQIVDKLYEVVDMLMRDTEKLDKMGKFALSLSKPEATESIVSEIEYLLF